jgi:hypothetical protein
MLNMIMKIADPRRWVTHSYPEFRNNPQILLNSQIAESGDFFIGINQEPYMTFYETVA